MEKIELDRSSFKALASDTRIKIIKELHEKDKRVTDLSNNLNLSKPTIIEHLKKLEDSNLVERKKQEKKRKRVYYELTDKSKSLLEPQFTRNVKILLVSVIIAFLGGLLNIYNKFKLNNRGSDQIGVMGNSQEGYTQSVNALIQNPPWLGILLLTSTIILFGITIWYYREKTSTIQK